MNIVISVCRGHMFLRNVNWLLTDYTASCPRRQKSSSRQMLELQILHICPMTLHDSKDCNRQDTICIRIANEGAVMTKVAVRLHFLRLRKKDANTHIVLLELNTCYN